MPGTRPRAGRSRWRPKHNPTIDTLARLAQTLDIEFAIDVHPREREPKLLSGRARKTKAIASYNTDTGSVLLAAG